MTKPRLFAYGTLRRGFPLGRHEPLRQRLRFTGEGSVAARLYDLGPYPGAVRSAEPGERLRGELFELTGEEALSALDEYEAAVTGSDSLFVRQKVEVSLDEGGRAEAWIYFYNRALGDEPRIASGDYLEHVRGAR